MENKYNELQFGDWVNGDEGLRLPSSFRYVSDSGIGTFCNFPLAIIHMAWDKGCSFEAEADGFGLGLGTHGDWSAIRDSSWEATAVMFEKAMNFLNGLK